MNWDQLIQEELAKPYFQNLVSFLKQEDEYKTIYPPKEKRLSALKLTPFDQVKVVIIGQDPYHDEGQAHGLAFSVEKGKFPPSLHNMFKELEDDMNIPYPKTGNLTPWAKQGVLLLNTILTVEAHKALSHAQKGWEEFTKKMITTLVEQKNNLVFVLWGKHAKQFLPIIKNHSHEVILSVHPSPLSAHRGFFGSKPYSKVNAILKRHGISEIDWRLN
jgi:uracil-DNA glycosylase